MALAGETSLNKYLLLQVGESGTSLQTVIIRYTDIVIMHYYTGCNTH